MMPENASCSARIAAVGAALAWLMPTAPPDAAAAEPCATFRTQHATFAVADDGALCALDRNTDRRSYLAPNQPAPLLSVRVGDKLHAPDHAVWEAPTRRLTLRFAGAGVSAVLARGSQNHSCGLRTGWRFSRPNRVELVLWGPYPTTIGDLIGEVVGVVRDAEFAVGLQALNAKTLGGYPTRENDLEADYTADDPGHYPDLPAELRTDQIFRGDTARRTEFGSVLQALLPPARPGPHHRQLGPRPVPGAGVSRRRRPRQQDRAVRLPGGAGAGDDRRHRSGRGAAPSAAGWRLGQGRHQRQLLLPDCGFQRGERSTAPSR